MQRDWHNFYQITKDNPPSERLVKAVELLGHSGEALDLGCGAGRDTRHLLACGFQVTAVDREAASLAMLANLQTARLHCVQSSFENFTFARYDLVNARFALPFMPAEHFSTVFDHIKTSLKPDGIFVGQFFGVHDTWNAPENNMTFFTRAEALARLENLEVVEFEEEDHDGKTAEGTPKHWHVYHIIARKPWS